MFIANPFKASPEWPWAPRVPFLPSGGAAPPPRTRSFWARPGAGSTGIGLTNGKAVGIEVAHDKINTPPLRNQLDLRCGSRSAEVAHDRASEPVPADRKPVTSPLVRGISWAGPNTFPLWCPARAYDRALELREHPEHLAKRLAGRSYRALKINYIAF